MDSVQRVRDLCWRKGIPICKLERDLGYGNGYISQLRRGMFPAKRLYAIAEYLGVTPEYLLGEEDKYTSKDGRKITQEDIKFALFGGEGEVTDAMFEEVMAFAAFVKEREARKKE